MDKHFTAVAWLREQLVTPAPAATTEWIFNKALAMEQEQIETAYNQGIEATFQFNYGDGKRYFTDTYKTEP